MSNEIWVLGATGRTGARVASLLAGRDAPLVLVGRNQARLEPLARELGARAVVAATPADMAAAIRRDGPAVVVNTVGPFQHTGSVIADAALEAGHYCDIANDISTFTQLLGRDEAARRLGHTLVTGAGFGVTATESVVTWLTEGRPPAERVRVDMIPSMESTAGRLGEALAASFVEGLPGVGGGGRFQSRRITDGRLARARILSRPLQLTTPDGDAVTTALMPLGELLAAHNASRARFVDTASSEAPSGRAARVLLPAVLPLLHVGPLRRSVARRLAAVMLPDRPKPREHSWGHARAEWANGEAREGWLRLPAASEFTAAVASEVAYRLLAGQGHPGAYTPAALFGPSLAEDCGGEYVLAEALA
ncbi:hypothetical protein OSC27_03720 [Microbacterium sp. STN6]|uniref:hypothetical protein n=1 Tax=Microbacterium sp. STN6 TaxID=2995588 RepID=UPI002260E56D|nr:hypothetical protein [Microbacterium sp. STN6]MCX7521383.1 hypothetical protein [Microbacterium sp. STN6]